MDTELLKTFLELNRTRHFGRTAENLFLTQSAVSARVRLLEDTLGIQLFTRDRHNIQLTPAGVRFLKHAETIVAAWNRACQDTAMEESRVPLGVGGVIGAWDTKLKPWLLQLYREMPQIALRAEVLSYEPLTRRLLEELLDIGFLFETPQMPELAVVDVGQVDLVMVATQPGLESHQAVQDKDYVLVDWGSEFSIRHARHYPGTLPSTLRMGYGSLAREFILDCGGCAYLAAPSVAQDVEESRLYRVEDAPIIERHFYAAYPEHSARRELIEETLKYFQPRPVANPDIIGSGAAS